MAFRDKSKIYELDVSLPRLGKGEFSTSVLSKELWKNSKIDITWQQFNNILVEIMEEIKREVCNNPLGVKLPFFLGELKIQYLPYRAETQDTKTSQQIGEVVPYLNLHSKGKIGKLVWERKQARKFNASLDMWAYEPAKYFEEAVANALQTNPDKFRIARTRVLNKAKTMRNPNG